MVRVETEQWIELDIETAAAWFCELSDEDQTQFFKAVTHIAEKWEGGLGQDHQWWLVGRHISDCKCSSVGARQMIETLYAGMHSKESDS